ncbi:mechanosensitive ion channel domain-containing protein [Agromyces sp. NPDC127015]|uniref:mechanosensitive ion channel domain-containing protein n=1 Tax=Agromyces sp. NPDC127015 TaxID=3347108 RepID=UPI003667B329
MAEWWSTLDINGWSIAGIVVTLLATWILARLSRRGARAAMARVPSLDDGVRLLAERVVGYTVWLIGIGIALSFLGGSVQPILAIALVVAVVLVFVLRGIADNFAASVVLQTRHPVGVGDELEVGDVVGVVTELNGRSVIVRSYDGRTVHLPNSQLLTEAFSNNSAHGARRSEIEVRAAASGTPRELIVEAVSGTHGVHRRETIQLRPITIGPDREVYRVRFWHHPANGVAVTAAVVDAVATALAERGIGAVVTSEPPPPPLVAPTEF